LKNYNLKNYIGFTSPFRRCLETAKIISHITDIKFIVDPTLVEPIENITWLNNHSNDFPDFKWETSKPFRFCSENFKSYINRVANRGSSFPDKTIAISHCSFIKDMTQFLSGK